MRGARSISLPWGVLTRELTDLDHEHGFLACSRQETWPSLPGNVGRRLDGIIATPPGTGIAVFAYRQGHYITRMINDMIVGKFIISVN